MREPLRGAAEAHRVRGRSQEGGDRRVLGIPTVS